MRVIVAIFTSLLLAGSGSAQVGNWVSRGIGGGGSLFNPSFNPHNPAEIYAGCDMSELFHSTDTGYTWRPEHFRRIRGGNHVGVQFTSDPQVRYSVDYSFDQMRPVRTTDAGASWSVLPGDPTYGGCWEMAVDPNHTANLLVVDYRNVYYSSDGGSTFSLKYSSPSLGGGYIAGAFWNLPDIYVGMNLGLLVSHDSGRTFSLSPYTGIPAQQGLLSFAGARANDTIRFYGLAADTTDIYVGIFGTDYWGLAKGVYTLDFGQSSWLPKVTGIQIGTDFPFFVGTTQDNVAIAYLAGSNSSGVPSIFKTTDAGSHWTQTFLTGNNQSIATGWCGSGGDRGWGYAECALGFTVCAGNPDLAAFSDYGFIHLTTDGGATWRQSYVTPGTQNPMGGNITPGRAYEGVGLENTSCWDLLWLNRDTIFCGATDIHALRSNDGGASWSFPADLNLNSTYRLLKHPVTRTLYAALSSVHDLYQSTYLMDSRIDGGSGLVKYSTNRGANWGTLHDFHRPVIWIELDPQRPNRMYAAVVNYTGRQGGIWVTDDLQNGSGSTWIKLPDPPRTQGHPFNIRVLNDGALVVSYSGRRDSSGRFTASSGVFFSSDSGRSWQDRSAPGLLYWTMDVVIDQFDPAQNTWLACVFSGWGGPPNGLGGLYRTTDRGRNWARICDLDRVGSATVHPANRDEMYLTTETEGLWYTSNLTSSNPSFSLVTSYPFGHPERVFYNPWDTNALWLTSFGAGLLIGDRSSGITAERPVCRRPEFTLAPTISRAGQPLIASFALSEPQRVSLGLTDVSGREVGLQLDERYPAGRHTRRLSCEMLPAGIYFCRFVTANASASRRVIRVER